MKQRVSSSYAAPATSIALTTAVISTCILCWLDKVNRTVVDPYLDEVFHVRQSQTYWRHQWSQWDPKITTPPGLYLLSYLLGAVGFLISRKPTILSASYLRSLNGLVLFNSLPILLRNLLRSIWAVTDSSVSENSNLVPEESNWAFSLTALNICLFPPIFFFSGLYYTDLAALLIVLEVYRQDLKRPSYSKNSLWKTVFSYQTALFTLSGITSLIFRQTNIFWVAVFLGGLRVIKTIRSVHTETQVSAINAVIESSWKDRKLYDPLVSDAAFEDYFKAGVSIGIAAAANICIVLAELLPYLMVLGSFGLFVLWNGSVVLGHKEFHTASLHLPQMLYIWPYFVFFSWPLIATPRVVDFWHALLSKNGHVAVCHFLPRLTIAACCILSMLLIVHFNTIVHPFTLADNRHYVFYVFRLLLRKPFIKYAVTPIYFVFGWATNVCFGGTSFRRLVASLENSKVELKSKKSIKNSPKLMNSEINKTDSSIRVSFVLVWLASTTLCLITAPLVEPRYYIMPWVIWRLHMPPSTYLLKTEYSPSIALHRRLLQFLPLVLEGAWYLIINAATGYLFLYKGFKWSQEPEQVQRFMW